VRTGSPLSRGHLDLDRDCNLVRGTMDGEDPVNLNGGDAHVRNLAFHMIGPERDVRIMGTLQHLILHSLVTTVASAVSAGGVDQDFPAYPALVKLLQTAQHYLRDLRQVGRGITF
jgi:hypothetical protein